MSHQWAPRKRDRRRSRSRRRDEEEQHSKEGPSDEFQKVGKGSKGRGRPGGPCWTCGGPHFQSECPHASAGKGNYPITTAWSSWRPGTFPGPSAAQWNSWLPKPKEKGKGKGKNKGGKGDLKGKEKGHVNEMVKFLGLTSGTTARLVELCTCCQYGALGSRFRSQQFVADLCAKLTIDENCRARFLGKGQDPQPWIREVESAREPNRLSFKDQPIHRIQVCSVGRRHGQVVPSFQCRAETTRSKTENECLSKRNFSGSF